MSETTSFEERVATLLEARDPDGLNALAAEAQSKADRKAVKRALFRLRQLGVEGAEEAPTTPAPGRSLGAASYPVLMGTPDDGDARLFTLALPAGATVTVVEARFAMPGGLTVLQGQGSPRASYVPWAQKLVARGERVEVGERMLARKCMEFRRCQRLDRVGPDVDTRLLARLIEGAQLVPHPMEGYAARKQGRVLSMKALAKQRERIAALVHEEPLENIRRQAKSGTGRSLFRRGDDAPVRAAAHEWAGEWGEDAVAETLLDTAAWCAGRKDHDGATTLSAGAEHPSQFLADFAVYWLG